MFKKFLLIGTLCVFTIVLLQTESSFGQFDRSRTVLKWPWDPGSLHLTVTGEGPGNYDKWPGKLTATVWTRYVSLLCMNPTKKKWPTRLGTPFFYEGEVTIGEPSDQWDRIKRNGAFTVEFTFTDELLFPDWEGCPEGACDTNKWWDCAKDENGQYLPPLIYEFDFRIVLESAVDVLRDENGDPILDENGDPIPDYFVDHDIGGKCILDEDLESYTCTDNCDDPSVCYNIDYNWAGDIIN